MKKLLLCCEFLIIFIVFESVGSSKLNLVVLQSSDDIFKQTDQSSTNNSREASSFWENEGFTVANATQISNSLGDTVNGSTHLLLATKSAGLTTRLIDFGHTFLSIKFSSIIGRSISVESVPSTTDEDIQQYEYDISTQLPSITTTDLPESTSSIPDTTTVATPTTIKATRKPNVSPAVLKLNTDNKYGAGKQTIKIALAQPEPKKSASTKKPKIEPKTPSKIIRRKRTLNSEEISQIHKIISSVSTNPDVGAETKIKEGDNTKDPDIGPEIPISDPLGQLPDDSTIVMTEPKKLSYSTWRASMDKSFRPPGFYITVDDKVVFDNWIGVWQNPGVMGRWVPPTRQKLWNETELLLEFSEDPNRDIKITFEWEPMDAYSYVFISNISISTYGQDIATPTKTSETMNDSNINNSTPISGITSSNGNKNITLYIVVKSNHDTGSNDGHPSQQSYNKGKNSSNSDISKSIDEISNLSNKIVPTIPNDSNKTAKSEVVKESKTKSKVKGNNQTVLYVACVTGILSLIILVTAIHKKMQLSKRQGKGC